MTSSTQQFNPLPIDRKMLLSIREAAEYSNIGINKIDEMLKLPNCPFVLYVGTKNWSNAKHLRSILNIRLPFDWGHRINWCAPKTPKGIEKSINLW